MALRFNFCGASRSQGRHGHLTGETEDARAALGRLLGLKQSPTIVRTSRADVLEVSSELADEQAISTNIGSYSDGKSAHRAVSEYPVIQA